MIVRMWIRIRQRFIWINWLCVTEYYFYVVPLSLVEIHETHLRKCRHKCECVNEQRNSTVPVCDTPKYVNESGHTFPRCPCVFSFNESFSNTNAEKTKLGYEMQMISDETSQTFETFIFGVFLFFFFYSNYTEHFSTKHTLEKEKLISVMDDILEKVRVKTL